ncbi:flagellar type III secretion system pore protein FliP [Rubrivirga sp. S365]|uniref:Flagellar biosynthetic protein FliP n=1 Tax=Rubrivirga litoralis TaxID=3075598 RepID=A0ABU3BPP7_9BACT|nr:MULTISPECIES: flagellar type III secretion system pore protein FliP [unclassified Rubrivirga]MDT0631257.1 flagellar type III secretion system pore protein FliP [Rubrivirga sp. F394]MDT7856040.1 flagellar type III secretion system pore protein FliP [Rubrivirga sp. S365]
MDSAAPRCRWGLCALGLLLLAAGPALAQEAGGAGAFPAPTAAAPPDAAPPTTEVEPGDGTPADPGARALPGLRLTRDGEDYELPIQLLLMLTVLTLAPSIMLLMTSFTRLIVVFSILRTALGMQQSPPNQVLIGLALFLTLFIMAPVISDVNDNALRPYLDGEISQEAAFEVAAAPTKEFMLAQTGDDDLLLFMDMAGVQSFASAVDVPLHVLVPAFVISELRIAFQIGFMVFIPFLIVDLIVASVLMSMGMMMLPPVMISLPIKLLLFVLTDGWHLLVESVVRGYIGA